MPVKHTFTYGTNEPITKELSPIKAIRWKCRECSNNSAAEIRDCEITLCPLHPFRFGKDPSRSGKKMTAEQIDALRTQLANARKAKQVSDHA